jgi:hypothetical protein
MKDAWRKGPIVTALFLDVKYAFLSISPERLLHNMPWHCVPKKYTDWLRRKLKGCHTSIVDSCNQGCPLSCISSIMLTSSMSPRYAKGSFALVSLMMLATWK